MKIHQLSVEIRNLAISLGATEAEGRRYAVLSAKEFSGLGEHTYLDELQRRANLLDGYIREERERQKRDGIHQTVGGWSSFSSILARIDPHYLREYDNAFHELSEPEPTWDLGNE